MVPWRWDLRPCELRVSERLGELPGQLAAEILVVLLPHPCGLQEKFVAVLPGDSVDEGNKLFLGQRRVGHRCSVAEQKRNIKLLRRAKRPTVQ